MAVEVATLRAVVTAEIASFQSAMNTADQRMAASAQKATEAGQKIEAGLAKGTAGAADLSAAAGTLQTALTGTAGSADKVSATAKALADALGKAQVAHARLMATTVQEKTSLDVLGRSYADLSAQEKAQVAQISEQIEANASLVQSQGAAAESLTSFGLALVAAQQLLSGLRQALEATAGKAADFDQMMLRVQSNTGLSDAAIGQMRDTIVSLGRESGVSFDDLAEAYKKISNFGFSGADATKVLDVAMQAAVATGSKTADTANLLAGTLRNYGMAAKDAAPLMNAMLVTVQHANMDLSQFNDVAGKGIAAARGYGVSIADADAVISALAAHQYTAQQSVTALMRIIDQVQHPAAKTTVALEFLGKQAGVNLVQDFTASGLAHRGLIGVMEDVETATHGQAGAIKDLFPQQVASRSMVMLLKGAYSDLLKAQSDNTAALAGHATPVQDGYNKSIHNLNVELAAFKNDIAGIGVKIGEELAGPLERVARGARKVLDDLFDIKHQTFVPNASGGSAEVDALKQFKALDQNGRDAYMSTEIPEALAAALRDSKIGLDATTKQIDDAIRKLETTRESAASAAAKISAKNAAGAAGSAGAATDDGTGGGSGQVDAGLAAYQAMVKAQQAEAKRQAAEAQRLIVEAGKRATSEIARIHDLITGTVETEWGQKSRAAVELVSRTLADLAVGDPAHAKQRGAEVLAWLKEYQAHLHQLQDAEFAKQRHDAAVKANPFFDTASIDKALQRQIAEQQARNMKLSQGISPDASNDTLHQLAIDKYGKSYETLNAAHQKLIATMAKETIQGADLTRTMHDNAEAARKTAETIASLTGELNTQATAILASYDAAAHGLPKHAALLSELWNKYAALGVEGLVWSSVLATIQLRTDAINAQKDVTAKGLQEQSGDVKRLAEGLADLASRYDDLYRNRGDYQGDTLAKFKLPSDMSGLSPKEIDAVKEYADAWKQLDGLEKHKAELEQIASTIQGTLSQALDAGLSHARNWGSALETIVKDTLKHVVVDILAANLTRSIMSALGHLGGAGGDFFNAGKLEEAAKKTALDLGTGSAALYGAAKELEKAAEQIKAASLTSAASSAAQASGSGQSATGSIIGSVVSLASLFAFADGTWEVPGSRSRGDSVPALLTPGEMVIPRSYADGMRAAGAGGGSIAAQLDSMRGSMAVMLAQTYPVLSMFASMGKRQPIPASAMMGMASGLNAAAAFAQSNTFGTAPSHHWVMDGGSAAVVGGGMGDLAAYSRAQELMHGGGGAIGRAGSGYGGDSEGGYGGGGDVNVNLNMHGDVNNRGDMDALQKKIAKAVQTGLRTPATRYSKGFAG